MRRIAQELGIRAPSLYEHIPNKETLEVALISEGFCEWAEIAEDAVRTSADPLLAIGAVHRQYATGHPHLYRLMTERPLPRAHLASGVEERAAQPLVDAVGGDEDVARALWSFLHGIVILELSNRFPAGADIDAAWKRGLAAFSRETRQATD